MTNDIIGNITTEILDDIATGILAQCGGRPPEPALIPLAENTAEVHVKFVIRHLEDETLHYLGGMDEEFDPDMEGHWHDHEHGAKIRNIAHEASCAVDTAAHELAELVGRPRNGEELSEDDFLEKITATVQVRAILYAVANPTKLTSEQQAALAIIAKELIENDLCEEIGKSEADE